MLTTLFLFTVGFGVTFLISAYFNLRQSQKQYHVRDKFWCYFIKPFSYRSGLITDLSFLYTCAAFALYIIFAIYEIALFII